ncbi:hypothetical protein H696_03955 [Fonticula alba]|uniref:Uncharacterized protein n=1 Tax=Fonticula alba TaxID=691883 RepID=A0A058Z5L6_FONAL|nr:hypothetical protein H696_03955 [Fonticula alba]KCV69535.1 hypothetical protein H696_03955 [Fonticula alba]|eukprot:XP_009496100.1 hypothetical protein H696_03955 [Fonticula alba]
MEFLGDRHMHLGEAPASGSALSAAAEPGPVAPATEQAQDHPFDQMSPAELAILVELRATMHTVRELNANLDLLKALLDDGLASDSTSAAGQQVDTSRARLVRSQSTAIKALEFSWMRLFRATVKLSSQEAPPESSAPPPPAESPGDDSPVDAPPAAGPPTSLP